MFSQIPAQLLAEAWGYPDEIALPSEDLTWQTNGAFHIHHMQSLRRELEDFGEQAVGGKEGSACVCGGGHKTLNLRDPPSFTIFLSIPSEHLPASEQSSIAETLSPFLCRAWGGGRIAITAPSPWSRHHIWGVMLTVSLI